MKLPTTTHHVGFTIGTVDWVAEVEVDETGYTIKGVMLDLDGKYAGWIEGSDLGAHCGVIEKSDGSKDIVTFVVHATLAIHRKIDALMEAHAAEVGQNEIDARADHCRESRDD